MKKQVYREKYKVGIIKAKNIFYENKAVNFLKHDN